MKPRIAATLVGALLCDSIYAQVTQRVSVSSTAEPADLGSQGVSISADGRYVAFTSRATNLVPNDTNAFRDVFVRDRQNGTTERVSINSLGVEADYGGGVSRPSISADGRYVAFDSYSSNLSPATISTDLRCFVRDRSSGTTQAVTYSSSVAPVSLARTPSISADGRIVAFVAPDNSIQSSFNGGGVFVFDLQAGTVELISVHATGSGPDWGSNMASISGDGRFVAFVSRASNLVLGDTGGFYDIFVRDRLNGITERVSVDPNGAGGNANSGQLNTPCAPAISGDGRFVVFQSWASNLVPGDFNGTPDVFVRDLVTGTMEKVSVDSSEVGGNFVSGKAGLAISLDGRFVAFPSRATNLVPGDTNNVSDIFLRDRLNGTTERVSVDSFGTEANGDSGLAGPSVSADGRYVAFGDVATNLVPGDVEGIEDIFVHDRSGGPLFTSLCEPGVGSVISCPCSNPPSGPGRGCDNSWGTGGAILSAHGGSYVSSDSLKFTTSGQNPRSLGILGQWSSGNSSGLEFGQGVRCTSGSLERLFSREAVSGSITVPDFAAGDPTISARSAAKGDPILPGQSRWYLVYYRDNTVLGGCAGTRTFNATQTGQVTWAP